VLPSINSTAKLYAKNAVKSWLLNWAASCMLNARVVAEGPSVTLVKKTNRLTKLSNWIFLAAASEQYCQSVLR
jgi:hypothetical protein